MSTHDRAPSPISRRAFLKRVGLAGTLSAVPFILGRQAPEYGVSAQAMAPTANHSPLRIGVVLPVSTVQPALHQSMLDGINLALSQHGGQVAGRPVELLVESYGSSPSAAVTTAWRLVMESQVDLLVGMIGRNNVATLRPLLEEYQVPLVVSDIGANITNNTDRSPWIFRSSLHHWQSNLALGAWAGTHKGRRAAIVSSFYESGYDSIFAFGRGFESADGEIIATVVSDLPHAPRDPGAVLAELAQQQPDLIYASYSGTQATAFVQAFAASPMAGRVPLIGTGFLTDEQLLMDQGTGALGIHTTMAWSPGLGTGANRAFQSAFAFGTGRSADAFAVLGYDTAQLILNAAEAAGGDTADTLRAALGTAQFEGPRGQITMDTATQDSAGPLFLREVQQTGTGFHNIVVGELGAIANHDVRVEAARSDLRSGWLNAYLAI